MVGVLRTLACAGVLFFVPIGRALAQEAPLTLVVDLRDAPRDVLHVKLIVPVSAGPMTLVYPKWIPGNHAPTGPISDVVMLNMRANGKSVLWHRDPLDLYAFHLDVPAGVSALDVTFDALLQPRNDSSTANLAVLEWNRAVMYPQGRRADQVRVAPSVVVPDGWQYGTALQPSTGGAGRVDFAAVTLETLIDSPVAAGRYFRKETLYDRDGFSNEIDIVSDAPSQTQMSAAKLDGFKRMVGETDALFGARHWQHYHFLLALSDEVEHNGLEHHESSDDRAFARTLVDDDNFALSAALLPHEFTHSWNGKYRRPAGLATPDFQTPMRDDLLWVYEGLTSYLGEVLSFRTGLRPVADYPDFIAQIAASLDAEPGRATRSLLDTAVAQPMRRAAAAGGPFGEMLPGYASLRRGGEYYQEAAIMWLEADQIIREQTHGRRTLDDFCRTFFGGTTTPPRVVTYTRGDVVGAMQAVTPYDWASFFTEHVDRVVPRLSLGGIERSGWRLVYNDKPSKYIALRERRSRGVDLRYSIGMTVVAEGRIGDVLVGKPAASAGLGPVMRLVAVDGRAYSPEQLHAAIRRAKADSAPIVVIVDDAGQMRTMRIDYHDGERYPHLERIAGRPDLLTQSVTARGSK